MPAAVDDFRYVILPVRPPIGLAARSIRNKAYEHWKTYWQRMFRHKAADFCTPLEFFRQDLVFCLFLGEEIAAQNLATFFHTDDLITLDLPYFQAFRGEAIRLMAAKQAKTVMSIEFTSVSPQFGERRTGLRLGEIVNALALETFLSKNIDVTVGTPRRLSGLSDFGLKQGYLKISGGFQKAGWDLDICLGFKGDMKKHPDPGYRKIIEQIWENKLDYSDPASNKSTVISHLGVNRLKPAPNVRRCYFDSLNELSIKLDSMNWTDKQVYGLWLAQAYYLVRHTTRLLSLCAGYCSLEQQDMHKRLLAHREEEEGHDKIALADLAALGLSLSQLPELVQTADLIQLQYDQLQTSSATSFFGYILLLEGLAVTRGRQIYRQAAESFGPRTARFLKVHAEDDVDHIEKAIQQVENFTINEQLLAIGNLRQSASIYLTMLNQIEAVQSTLLPDSKLPHVIHQNIELR